jgi:hypothetical protein
MILQPEPLAHLAAEGGDRGRRGHRLDRLGQHRPPVMPPNQPEAPAGIEFRWVEFSGRKEGRPAGQRVGQQPISQSPGVGKLLRPDGGVLPFLTAGILRQKRRLATNRQPDAVPTKRFVDQACDAVDIGCWPIHRFDTVIFVASRLITGWEWK